ncbi:MAG: hypothetical protein AABY01_00785 [Nanoarchaeota archaeon]
MAPNAPEATILSDFRKEYSRTQDTLKAKTSPLETFPQPTGLTSATRAFEGIANEYGYAVSDIKGSPQFYDPQLIILTYVNRMQNKNSLENILVKSVRYCAFPAKTMLTDLGGNAEMQGISMVRGTKQPLIITKNNQAIEAPQDAPYFNVWHSIYRTISVTLHDTKNAKEIQTAEKTWLTAPTSAHLAHYTQLEQQRLRDTLVPAWRQHTNSTPLVVALLPLAAWLTYNSLLPTKKLNVDILVLAPKNAQLPVSS